MPDYTVDTAIDHYMPQLEGGGEWSTIEKCHAIKDAMRQLQPKTAVEIGVWGGGILICGMGFVARELHEKGIPGTIAVGIDPWMASASMEHMTNEANKQFWVSQEMHEKVFGKFVAAVAAHHLADSPEKTWLTYHRMKSVDAASMFGPKSIGLLHLDGNHSEAASLQDVELYAPLIQDGGLWFFDDTNWEESPGVISTLKAQKRLIELGFVEVLDKKKWKVFRKGDKDIKPLPRPDATAAPVAPVAAPSVPRPTPSGNDLLAAKLGAFAGKPVTLPVAAPPDAPTPQPPAPEVVKEEKEAEATEQFRQAHCLGHKIDSPASWLSLAHYVEVNEGRMTLAGSFDVLNAPDLPATLPMASLAVRLLFRKHHEGHRVFAINIVDKQEKPMFAPEKEVKLEMDVKLQDYQTFVSHSFQLGLTGLQLHTPGEFNFVLKMDGHEIARTPLVVAVLPKPKLPVPPAPPAEDNGGETNNVPVEGEQLK